MGSEHSSPELGKQKGWVGQAPDFSPAPGVSPCPEGHPPARSPCVLLVCPHPSPDSGLPETGPTGDWVTVGVFLLLSWVLFFPGFACLCT